VFQPISLFNKMQSYSQFTIVVVPLLIHSSRV